jgi:outer membrane lipoprotein-sorting protein
MNRILIFILLFFNLSLVAKDEKAKEILDQLSINTKSYESIDVDFTFDFINISQEINEKQEGNIKISKNKFRLDLNQQIIISDDTTQWIYLKESNELQILEYDAQDDMLSPNKLFTIYEKGYKTQYIEEKDKVHIIDLFPIESSEFKNIQLQIDVDKIQIKKIILNDKNGGSFSYSINRFSTNTQLDEKLFNFNQEEYPEIEIIDLR